MNRYIRSILPMGGGLLLAIAPILFASPVAQAADTTVKTFSTGIGVKERSAHAGYSTVLFFSEKGSGSMLADVKLTVFERGEKGQTKILSATSPDPLFFADLPPGKYYVEAVYRGQKQGSVFTIDGRCQKAIGLSWQMPKAVETEWMARGEHEHRARSDFVAPCTVGGSTSG